MKSAYLRRLSSPIINPNFEEDIDTTLMTTMNTDDVLASLSGLTLASSAGNDELKDIGHDSSVNRDDSWGSDDASGVNYKESEEVNAVRFFIGEG